MAAPFSSIFGLLCLFFIWESPICEGKSQKPQNPNHPGDGFTAVPKAPQLSCPATEHQTAPILASQLDCQTSMMGRGHYSKQNQAKGVSVGLRMPGASNENKVGQYAKPFEGFFTGFWSFGLGYGDSNCTSVVKTGGKKSALFNITLPPNYPWWRGGVCLLLQAFYPTMQGSMFAGGRGSNESSPPCTRIAPQVLVWHSRNWGRGVEWSKAATIGEKASRRRLAVSTACGVK